MPIVGPVNPSTGQPSFAGIGYPIFGGLALPNGQGTLGYVNLNDAINWFLQDMVFDRYNRSIGIQPQVSRGKSVYTSDDFLSKTITLPMRYSEVNYPIDQALAQLSQAGEQRLSFDGTTYILAKYRGVRNLTTIRKFAPLLWGFQLEFICREPWFKDISSTTSSTVSLVGAPVAPPSGVALAGGAMTAGTYTLAYTYVTASGETAASPSTTLAPAVAVSDYRVSRSTKRGHSRATGVSAQQASMGGVSSPTRSLSSFATTRVLPQGSAVTLSGSNLQISVGAVTFPSWATGVKWYVTSGPASTTGFTVQNANGNAFTLNTIGNGTGPPTSTPATAFTVTYAGSVFCEPIYTITIPAANPSSISQIVLANTMSSETLTITPSGTILGGRAVTLTVDGGAWTVLDGSGNSYDYTGSFPELYGPAGQSNAFTLAVTGTPTDTSGVTIAATYNNRWD